MLGTLLSFTRQGFHFGIINNIFHIPIVLRLFDLGQFSQDPFYQSLRNFTSIVWPALSLIATPANVAAVFLAAHLVSRLLLYFACVWALIQMGVRSILALSAFVLVLACGPVFMGYSMIGATGLQIDYFTHTELTYPLVIFSLILASRKHFSWAFAVNGVTFNVNAFVGVWLVVVLALLVIAEPDSLQRKVRNLSLGGLVQGLISLPTIVWILRTIRDSHGAPSFDYRAFLAYYFPKHFLIQASSFPEIVQFAMVCISGAVALYLLGGPARPWAIAFIGCIALFAAGVILPLVSSSRLLLNLALLRIDGVVMLMSLLFATVAASPCLRKGEKWGAAMAVLATAALGDWRLTAIALTIFAWERAAISLRGTALSCAAVGGLSILSQIGSPETFQFQHVLVAMLCFLLAFLEDRVILVALGTVVASMNFPILCAGSLVGLCATLLWREQGALWMVASTGLSMLLQAAFYGMVPKTAVTSAIIVGCSAAFLGSRAAAGTFRARFYGRFFTVAYACLLAALLIPWAQVAALVWLRSPQDPQATEDRAWGKVQQWARGNTPSDAVFLVPADSEGFELGSYRHVWTDYRQGAAVMWSPAYYSLWMNRYPGVRSLKNHSDFYHYALAHSLRYYVIPREARQCNDCVDEMQVYSNSYFEVYRVTSANSARN
ncbi:MAG: DUF6798 domain-containing protein [Bryobacteraceae bacterium]